MNQITLHPPRDKSPSLPEMGDLFIDNNQSQFPNVYILAALSHGPDADGRKYALVRLSDGFSSRDPYSSIKELWEEQGPYLSPWKEPLTIRRTGV